MARDANHYTEAENNGWVILQAWSEERKDDLRNILRRIPFRAKILMSSTLWRGYEGQTDGGRHRARRPSEEA